MKLSIGIVGLPNVGKSTLFKALTKIEVNIANYPFATIDPNIGVVPVPDERLDKLYEISQPKPASAQGFGRARKIPAIVEFYDIAGLVKGAYKGEGLGNQFLSHIREVSAIVEVLRCFPAGEIIHVEQTIDPLRDMEIVNAELALKDLETIEKVWKKMEGEARTGNKQAKEDLETLKQAKTILEKGELLFSKSGHPTSPDYRNIRTSDVPRLKELNLLTAKPQIYLLNGTDADLRGPNADLRGKIKEMGADYVVMDLVSISGHPMSQDRTSDVQKLGELDKLIQKAYEVLNLISFFTTGEDETRAWTIERGTKAPQAAGAIHTDFEKKFVKAEVINWQKLLDLGGPSTHSASSGQAHSASSGQAHSASSGQAHSASSGQAHSARASSEPQPNSSGQAGSGANAWTAARQKGQLRLEGRDYIVQDGDVIVFKHG